MNWLQYLNHRLFDVDYVLVEYARGVHVIEKFFCFFGIREQLQRLSRYFSLAMKVAHRNKKPREEARGKWGRELLINTARPFS